MLIDVKKISELTQQQILKAIQEEVVDVIKERVRNGIGLDDFPMPPYSSSYKKQGSRDLNDTGKMLSDLEATLVDDKIIVGFSSAESEKKAYHNHYKHPWFGLSKKDQEKLIERIERK